MDLKQLEYFVKVAEFGSFSRAADALDVEQPAISKQVRMLEVELRQTLLTRTGRGVLPTAAGKILLQHGRGILHQVARAREELGRVQGALAGRVAIGLPPSIARVLAAPLIREVRLRMPQVTLAVTEGMSFGMQESLANGSLDIALLYNAAASADVAVTTLLEEELFLVRRKAFETVDATAATAPVTMREIASLPLVLPTLPNTLRLLVETEMASLGYKPLIAFEVDGVPAILDLVAEGLGSTLLSSRAVETSAHAQSFVLQQIEGPPLRSKLSVGTSSQRPATLTQKATLEIIYPVARALLL
jgi:LysR family nitrogen assimilation transcriptional regulator